MKKNIDQFVRETISHTKHFDINNINHIKEVVRYALSYYELKSYVEIENIEIGTIEYLYLHSMAEENLLSKVVQQSLNSNKSYSIEDIYQGYVIRRH
ncbi:hypothetical protein BTR23_25115 [Alkalihalophilus pseudofirmus]|nr:hypothetical protein BTR23_25115 [Alkalihalophilus pseudofirmus]